MSIQGEKKVFKGIWWLPENTEEKINGVLKIVTGNKVILELEGVLEEKEIPFIINGKTNDKVNITLVDCYILKATDITMRDGSKRYESAIKCRYAFIGIHYDCKDVIRFKELTARYTNFVGWTGIKRPEIIHEHSSIKIDNLEHHTVETTLDDGCKITLESYWFPDFFTTFYSDKLSLEKFSDVKFEFINDLLFEECLEYIYYFRNFISISLRDAVGILNIFPSDMKDDKTKDVEIYCNFYALEGEKELIYHNALFTLKDIEEDFNSYLYNFFSKKNVLNYIVNVYYEILRNKSPYITEEFLLFTRLIESYHRYNPSMESIDLPKDKFKTNRKAVLALIESNEPSLKGWLCKAINRYGNNKSFSDILRDIIGSLCDMLYGLLQGKKIDLFIKKVRDTRNILTHPKDNVGKDNEYINYIHPMTRKLEILLLSLILKEIGFEDEIIRNIFFKKSELQYYFRDYNWELEPNKFI
jgi:hypothetical protein